MISAQAIRELRLEAVDFGETDQLKKEIAELRSTRTPFHLTAAEFDRILRWKLRQQYGRRQAYRVANTDEIIRAITGLALTIEHPDKEYEMELRIQLLCALRGVAVPVASAVLALTFPNEYAVIDFRGWRQVFEENKTEFSVPNYKRYMQEIRRLAQELDWSVQEVDLAIWEFDRRHMKPL